MLLDYAAQMKCLTQRRVVHTAIALSHLPADVHHFVINFSHNAQRLLANLTDELRAIGTRRHARRRVKKRLDRTQQQLLKATQLIERGQQVVDRVRAHQSDDDEDEEEEEEVEVNIGGMVVGEEEEEGEDITEQVEGAEAAGTDSLPAAANLDALTEQIRQLKEQMEQLARMQSIASGASSQEDEDEEDDAPHNSEYDSPLAAIDVPVAPPLLSFSVSGSSMSFACIPIASPMLAGGDVPMAPPLITAAAVPMAPPMSPPAATTASVPAAPPLDASAPWSVTPPSAAAVPTLSSLARPPTVPTTARSALTLLSPNRPSTSSSSSSSSSLLPSVYTRNIPGAAELSHTDLIKVAAAIKLRRTNLPRSPGGTPVKRLSETSSGGMGGGSIGEALRRKFQNVNGGGRTSGLLTVSGGSGGSGVGRRSWGEKDKENNEWSTD